MIPVIAAFLRTVAFMDLLREEGRIRDYALVGGLALSAGAELAALVESRLHRRAVIKRGSRRTLIQDELSFVVGQIEVDLIGTRGFGLAAEAVEQALVTEVFGKRVKIATPEYLILLKLLPLRAQDRIDIPALVKQADRRELRTLAKRHFLLAGLESALKKKD